MIVSGQLLECARIAHELAMEKKRKKEDVDAERFYNIFRHFIVEIVNKFPDKEKQ